MGKQGNGDCACGSQLEWVESLPPEYAELLYERLEPSCKDDPQRVLVNPLLGALECHFPQLLSRFHQNYRIVALPERMSS